MSAPVGLLLTLVLLLLNGFFVAAEFAVMSARRSQVEPLADAGSRAAKTALVAMENVSLMLACAQIGITVCSLGLGAVAEPAIAHLIEAPFEAVHLPENLLHPVAFAIALALVTYLHVVIGEMVPKNLTLSGPDRAVLLLAPPLAALARVLTPVIAVLNAVANGFLRLLRVEPRDEVVSTFTADEVHSIVTESTREGVLADDHGLLSSAIEFSEQLARDVMVPLDKLVTVAMGGTPQDVERLVARTGYSRFPVTEDGAVTGYVHIKDTLYADDDRHHQPIPPKRIRSLVPVRALDEVEDALAALQRVGSHLARVVDEEGRTLGVLFLEDIIEELVGEVLDATQRARHSAP